MSIHYNLYGERYETDRDGTVYHPSDDPGVCDGCGGELDDGEFYTGCGWLCAGCIEEMKDVEEEDESL